ncbi:MAG: hypothetical protein AB1Z98_34200 [Nannocystaceae bacterium]
MATDYTTWEMRQAQVSELFLDPQNPRIDQYGGTTRSPANILADLVEHENIKKLATSIAERGFFPNEILLVVQEKVGGVEELVVVEGNRRLAAMKALLSPEAVPERFQAVFRRLAKSAGLSPAVEVPILIVPHRDDATPLIVARHTHAEIKRWSVYAQGRYFSGMRNRGYSLSDISKMSGLPEGKVLGSLRTHTLYQTACAMTFDKKTSGLVQDSRKFPMTTLERVFASKVMQGAFKSQFKDEDLHVGVAKNEFQKGFKRIVSDLAHRAKDSRSLNSAQQLAAYLDEMGSDRPKKTSQGTFIVDGSGLVGAKPPGTAKKPAPKKRAARRSKSILPSGFKPRLFGTRVAAVYTELRGLELDRKPNASALLLRTLIDLCVTECVEMLGATEDLEKPFRNKGRPKWWAPTLRQSLTFLLEHYDLPGLTGQKLTAARKFATQKEGDLCLDDLDKFTHNKYSPPTPEGLRAMWTHIEPLMFALVEVSEQDDSAANEDDVA